MDVESARAASDPPNPSLALDLLWADPDKAIRGWRASTRGGECGTRADSMHTSSRFSVAGLRRRRYE